MSTRSFFLGCLLATALSSPSFAIQVSADVTIDPHSTAGFSAPIFTFSNLSSAGYQISNVKITGGFFDYVWGPATTVPITAPAGGSYTAINGTQVANSNLNDGCNAVDFNMSGFDPGEQFRFLADAENNACQNVVYDFRQRLAPTSGVFGFASFTGAGIVGSLQLSGNNWVKELINPNGADVELNQRYRLSLSQTLPTTNVPEPASLALFGSGLAGLVALRRRRKAKT